MKRSRNISQIGNSVIASATGVAAIGASLFNVPGAILGAIIGGAIGAAASRDSWQGKSNSISQRGVIRRHKRELENESVY